MSAKSTTNFRSYEAQARLLAAVIATAKPKLDYKGKLLLVLESSLPIALFPICLFHHPLARSPFSLPSMGSLMSCS